jgi:hypothetical protein
MTTLSTAEGYSSRLRIRRTGHKVLFMVVFIVIAHLISVTGRLLAIPEYMVAEVLAWIVVAAVYVGTRAFRGEGENVAPSRPWWRMSTRPTASFVLGTYFIYRSAISIWSLYTAVVSGWMDFTFILLCVADPVIAWLYLTSGVRLRRAVPDVVRSSPSAP